MYFKDFPKFLYDFRYDNTDETKTSVVTDITRNVRLRKEILSSVSLYDEYDIRDGETPEIIAEKVYGNPNYHWIIMLANEKYDYISDFPMKVSQLEQYIIQKYNPELYSVDGEWYFEDGKLWFAVSNASEAFDPQKLVAEVTFTVSGSTVEDGEFTITHIWGDDSSGIDAENQRFWVETDVDGTPVGVLTITTSGRENNPVYWETSDGLKVSSDHPDALAVNGAQDEDRINESKRRIKIISPEIVGTILRQFKESL